MAWVPSETMQGHGWGINLVQLEETSWNFLEQIITSIARGWLERGIGHGWRNRFCYFWKLKHRHHPPKSFHKMHVSSENQCSLHHTEAWDTGPITSSCSYSRFPLFSLGGSQREEAWLCLNRRQSYSRQWRTDSPELRCSPETQPEPQHTFNKPSWSLCRKRSQPNLGSDNNGKFHLREACPHVVQLPPSGLSHLPAACPASLLNGVSTTTTKETF